MLAKNRGFFFKFTPPEKNVYDPLESFMIPHYKKLVHLVVVWRTPYPCLGIKKLSLQDN